MNETAESVPSVIVVPDSSFPETQKRVMLARCPNIWTYATPQTNNLPPQETKRYDGLNASLHETIAATVREWFLNHPVPKYHLDKNDPWIDEREKYEFYTHQNWDWYGPTQECYIAVVSSEINIALLRKLQELLVDTYANWEIVVVASEDHRMEHGPEIAVFSDTIVIPKSMDHVNSNKDPHRTKE